MKLKKNNSGQGLIEYLIIVALVSVAAIGIVKVISQNMRFHFTQIAETLGSNPHSNPTKGSITKSMHEEKDFNNFWEGSKK